MIAPLFNNSIHGDVLMRRDWIDTCLKYKPPGEVKNVLDMVSCSPPRCTAGREMTKPSRSSHISIAWLTFGSFFRMLYGCCQKHTQRRPQNHAGGRRGRNPSLLSSLISLCCCRCLSLSLCFLFCPFPLRPTVENSKLYPRATTCRFSPMSASLFFSLLATKRDT